MFTKNQLLIHLRTEEMRKLSKYSVTILLEFSVFIEEKCMVERSKPEMPDA